MLTIYLVDFYIFLFIDNILTKRNIYNPGDIIKKEVRGPYGIVDFGEVQEVTDEYIITEKGSVDKERYYFPKYLVDYFDGATLYLKLTEEEAIQYKRV